MQTLDSLPSLTFGRAGLSAVWLLVGLIAGCQTPSHSPAPAPRVVVTEQPSQCEEAVFQRASEQQSTYFENETHRLSADLEEAEAAMIAIESGTRSGSSRADAVSVLAEARIAIERAEQGVPWRTDQAAEAQDKLAQAESHLEAGNLGTAVFFASRARRIADTLSEEAVRVAGDRSAKFVKASRVNIRSGPSKKHEVLAVLKVDTPVFPERPEGSWWLVRTLAGQVGWIHTSLLR